MVDVGCLGRGWTGYLGVSLVRSGEDSFSLFWVPDLTHRETAVDLRVHGSWVRTGRNRFVSTSSLPSIQLWDLDSGDIARTETPSGY